MRTIVCMLLIMLATVSTALAAPAASQTLEVALVRPTVNLISNVVFSQPSAVGYSNVALKMDILQPKSAKKMPAVVFVTGGGFLSANKDRYLQQRLTIAESGYVVASIDYRTVPATVFPGPLEDVKSAVRYLRANADKWGIDAEHIAVMGDSAGGYLAAMTGTTNGYKEFDKGDYLDQNSDVQAAIDIYGLSDLTKVGDGFSAEVQKAHKSAAAPEALWVYGPAVFSPQGGSSIGDDPKKAAAANPLTYISKLTPPFLLMHGDQDTLVSPKQTEILHEALLDHGIESTRYVVKGAQHGGDYWVQPEITNIIIDFLNKHLKQ